MLTKLIGRLRRGDRQPEKNSGIRLESATGVKPLTIEELIKRHIREGVIAAQLGQQNADTFEEADDFEEDDPEVIPLTHHQVIAMTDSELREQALSGYGIDLVDDTPASGPSASPDGEAAQAAAGSSGGNPPLPG